LEEMRSGIERTLDGETATLKNVSVDHRRADIFVSAEFLDKAYNT